MADTIFIAYFVLLLIFELSSGRFRLSRRGTRRVFSEAKRVAPFYDLEHPINVTERILAYQTNEKKLEISEINRASLYSCYYNYLSVAYLDAQYV